MKRTLVLHLAAFFLSTAALSGVASALAHTRDRPPGPAATCVPLVYGNICPA